ncbi:MAG: HAMP domain-containing histidine kinase, partial [Proteobacteria bacterium]
MDIKDRAALLGFSPSKKLHVVDNWLNQFVFASSNRFEIVRNKVFIISVILSVLIAGPNLLPYGIIGQVFYGIYLLMAVLLVFTSRSTQKLNWLKILYSSFLLVEIYILFFISDKAFTAIVFWAPTVITMFSLFHGVRKAFLPCAVYIVSFIVFGFILSRQADFHFAAYMSKDQIVSILVTTLSSQVFLIGVIFSFERAKMRAENDLKVEYEKRLEARRMAFVRELIGNVAHEINNPLAIIQASVIRLERSGVLPNSQEHRQMIQNIEEAVLRICSVRDGLGHFAVGNKKEKLEAIDVRSLFKKVIHQVKGRAAFSHLIFSDRSQGLQILCRPKQICTALNALIANASEAIDCLDNGKILVEAYLDRQNLCLRVTDNGRGIAEELREKIFLPFFSTHGRSENRGLGLSVSRGTIAEHGGQIEYENQKDGTRFTIRLPLNLSNQISP